VIQAFLPREYVDEYRAWMHRALGFAGEGGVGRRPAERDPDPVFVMSIRPSGLRELQAQNLRP
jgi:hypothetical protein